MSRNDSVWNIDGIVLIVAKCNVNHDPEADVGEIINVLIVAKCNVNITDELVQDSAFDSINSSKV